MFLPLPRIRVHACVDGPTSGSVLVFVNALGSDLHIWDGVVSRLSAEHRCVRYDKRGHGRTEDVEPYDLSTQTDDLLAVFDALELDQATVVGISVGGLIALQAALTRPERVRALVLCDTAARIGTGDGWTERIALVEAHGLRKAGDTIVPRWFAAGFAEDAPSHLDPYTSMLSDTSTRGYLGTCALLRDSDLRGRVHEIACPALVLTGSEDLATPPDQGRALARSLSNGRFAEIRGAGHLPSVEAPLELSRLIRTFLEDVVHV